jgi:hypothetical protein
MISSAIRKVGPFVGNGSASVFPFTFKVFSKSDLVVVRAQAGVETTLTVDSDFTVVLNADQDGSPGGSITLTAGALAVGYTLIISSNIAETQQTQLTNLGGFYPEVITAALDKLTILVQQQQEKLDRAVTLPITDPSLDTDLPSASFRLGKLLAFDGITGAPVALNATDVSIIVSGDTIYARLDGGNLPFTNWLSSTLGFQANGATSGNTKIQASATASGTLTLPAATDTLVARSTAETLSNKTLTSPVITAPTITGAATAAQLSINGGTAITGQSGTGGTVAMATNATHTTPQLVAPIYSKSNTTLANGANNNVVTGTGTFIPIIGPSGAFSISGFAGGTDGRIIHVFNTVAVAMTIANEGAGSSAANRITTLTGADVTLRAGTSFASFIYNGGASRWILMSTN